MKANALWHISQTTSAIREEELPQRKDHTLLVESLYSLVSLGTERLVACGLIPESIWDKMTVPYMGGSFALPCKYGYSLAGKVLKGPSEYRGKTVHLMHPHQDKAWVDASSVFVIPDGIPVQRAVMAGQVETAVNALWDSRISLGDSLLIAGFGLVGAIIALLASDIPGVKVSVLEKNEFRKEFAREMRFRVLDKPEDNEDIFDVAIHTAGDEKALQFCIDHIGNESQVTEVSFYGKKSISVTLGETFHTRRKRIVMSQVSQIPSRWSSRWDFRRRKELVFELLRDTRYDLPAHKIVPFEQAALLFNQIRYGPVNEIALILKYK